MFLEGGASSSSAWHLVSAFPSPNTGFQEKFSCFAVFSVVWKQEGRAHRECVFGIVCQGSCWSEYICFPYFCFNCTNGTCTFSCTLLAELYQSLDQITDLSYPWSPSLVYFYCRSFWRTLGEWNYLESFIKGGVCTSYRKMSTDWEESKEEPTLLEGRT